MSDENYSAPGITEKQNHDPYYLSMDPAFRLNSPCGISSSRVARHSLKHWLGSDDSVLCAILFVVVMRTIDVHVVIWKTFWCVKPGVLTVVS